MLKRLFGERKPKKVTLLTVEIKRIDVLNGEVEVVAYPMGEKPIRGTVPVGGSISLTQEW